MGALLLWPVPIGTTVFKNICHWTSGLSIAELQDLIFGDIGSFSKFCIHCSKPIEELPSNRGMSVRVI